MTVKELIKELKKFDPSFEVTITDGFEGLCYTTKRIVLTAFRENDGTMSCDIGIGNNRYP